MLPFKASDNGGGPSPIITAELPGPHLSPKAACELRARNVVEQSPHLRWLTTLATLRDTASGYTQPSIMIYTTQIARLDGKKHRGAHTIAGGVLTYPGLVLVASTDDSNVSQLSEFKQQIRQIIKRLGPSAEPRASIEGDAYTMQ